MGAWHLLIMPASLPLGALECSEIKIQIGIISKGSTLEYLCPSSIESPTPYANEAEGARTI